MTTLKMEKFSKIFWLIVTVSVVVVCAWFAVKLWDPAAREKALRMYVLQRQAEELFNTAEVRLYNKVAGIRRLGHFRPNAVLPHSETCTPPSTKLRFLPLVGE